MQIGYHKYCDIALLITVDFSLSPRLSNKYITVIDKERVSVYIDSIYYSLEIFNIMYPTGN